MVYPMQFVAKQKFPVANAIVNGISCLTFMIVLTIYEPLKVATVRRASPVVSADTAATR